MRSTIEPGLVARCPRCGGSVPADARRCRRCGMGLGDQVLLLGPGRTDDGDDDPGPPPAVAPRKRRSRWVDLAGLAALFALLFGVNAVAAPEGEEPEAAEPSSTTTTIERRRSTTTERPRPTTTSTALAGTLGPLLPEPTGTVLVVETSAGLAAIDVDTGQVAELGLTGVGAGQWAPAVAVGEHVVVVRSATAYAVRPFSGGPATELGAAEFVLPGSSKERIWLQASNGNVVSVRAVSLDGVETVPSTMLPIGVHPLAALPGGLLIDASGSLMLLDPVGGSARRLGDGQFVGLVGSNALTFACDEDLRCGLHLTDLVSGVDRVVTPPEGWAFEPWFVSAASTDGRWALLPVASKGAALLVDVEAGSATIVDGRFTELAPVFSPDGRWLFQLRGEALYAGPTGGEMAWIDAIDFDLRNVLVALPTPSG